MLSSQKYMKYNARLQQKYEKVHSYFQEHLIEMTSKFFNHG